MKHRYKILVLASFTALFLNGPLFLFCPTASFADESASASKTDSRPQELPTIWKYIDYRFLKPQEEWDGRPSFLLTSGERDSQVSRGLRLDIMSMVQGFRFFKTNTITARLYRANGEIVGPTAEGKKLLNQPVSTSWAAILPDGGFSPEVLTYFPWGTNTLGETWIEVSIPPDRYWLEVPYGFDRNPADPLPSSVKGGPPKFIPAMKSLTEHDHVKRWENVHYDLGRTPDGCELSLIQSNPFDGRSKVELYSDHGARNLYSPHTDVRLMDADGSVIDGRCVNLHLDDNHLRRTDTFDISNRGADDWRCWGQIEIKVDDQAYRVIVPSSLYKYVHGRAFKPASTAFLSLLHVGMTLQEADRLSRNYVDNGIRNYPVSPTTLHQYQYVFKPDASEITLQFDAADRLMNWK
jgi:hypothetical protein